MNQTSFGFPGTLTPTKNDPTVSMYCQADQRVILFNFQMLVI